MQKDSLAKSLRAQYPGHRDYVDEVFAKSSREDPANKYISSLVGDINSLSAAAKDKRNAVRTLSIEALREGFPDADVMSSRLANGQMTDDQYKSYYYKYSSQKYQRLQEEHDWHANEEEGKSQAQAAERIITEQSGKDASNYFYNKMFATTNLNTPAGIQDMAHRLAAGEEVSSEDKEKALQSLRQARASFITDGITKFSTSSDPTKPSYATSATMGKTREILEDTAKLYFDPVIDQFEHDKTGLIYSTQLMNQGMLADKENQLFRNPNKEWAEYMKTLAVAGKMLPPSSVDKFMLKGMADKNFDKSLWTYATQEHIYGAVQPGSPDKPHTISTAVSTVQAALGKNAPAKAAAVRNMLDDANDITDKSIPDEVKRNTVTRFFDPSNRNFLGKFDSQSKTAVFQQLTEEPLTKEIHKLGGRSWDQYQGWVKDEFGTQLYPEAIRNLNELDPQMQLAWNSEKHQIMLNQLPGPRSPVNQSDLDQQLNKAQSSVNQLNTGLRAVSNVASYSGEDVNSYMYKLLLDSGYQGPLLKAIVSANQSRKTSQ